MSNQPVGGLGRIGGLRGGSWAVAAVGIGLAALGGWHFSTSGAAAATGAVDMGWSLFINVGLPLGIAIAAVALVRRTGSQDRVVLRWVVGGVLALVGLAAWASFDAIVAGRFADARGAVVLGANLGLLFGTVAGLNHSRAIQNAELAERERAQREGMAFLNHLLRHHVLNGMTIINGYVEELHEEDVSDEHLEVIERQSDRIVSLVENVQALVESLSGDLDPRPVDVERVVRRAVADARETYPSATFEVETDSATVRATDLVRTVVDNLLANAVEHHDGDATVEVAVMAGDPVRIRITDDGPGVPDEIRAAFERRDDFSTGIAGEGMGLYLVHTLVRNYGGEVRIEEREPRGTVVTVELPRA